MRFQKKKKKIEEKLDVSDTFWPQFEIHNKNVRQQIGLYEIENIRNTNICTTVVNSK